VSRSPTRAAKALALAQHIAWRGWVVALDAAAYRELAALGLNRSDIRLAIDDLVAEGTAEVTASAGRVRVRVREAS